MIKLVEFPKQAPESTVNQHLVGMLEAALQRAKEGEMTQAVVIAIDSEGSFSAYASLPDRLRMLGAVTLYQASLSGTIMRQGG